MVVVVLYDSHGETIGKADAWERELEGTSEGFCICAVGDWFFCVGDANTVGNANSWMPLPFCHSLLESV
jgi:hypothetical protein